MAPTALVVLAVTAALVTAPGETPLEGAVDARPAAPPRISPDCRLGERDLNPTDAPVAPAPAGRRLLLPREDGRVPIGFNDNAPLAGASSAAEAAVLQRPVDSTIWRVPIDWRFAEPAPGDVNLAPQDQIYCEAIRNGIRPLFALTAAPDWAADSERRCAGSECHFPPRREHLADLTRISELIAIRYPAAAAIEAWNEPNLAGFWAEPDPDYYVEVLRAIYRGVKNGNPALPVLGGSLGNPVRTVPDGRRWTAVEFADRMYAAGAAEAMDAISLHPHPVAAFGAPAERFSRTMAELRALLALRDEGRRIWITELGLRAGAAARGAPAAPGTAASAVTKREQEESLLEIYRRVDRSGDIDAVLFHALIEPADIDRHVVGFGWVVPLGEGRFEPKPVYCAFARLLAEPISCDEPIDVG